MLGYTPADKIGIGESLPRGVSTVGKNTLGGRVVVIVSADGTSHDDAHLEDYTDIEVKDGVEAGDIIGYIDDSSNAKGTPPHVHYGTYFKGGTINPYLLLKMGNHFQILKSKKTSG